MKRALVFLIGALALAACESPPVSDGRLQGSGSSSGAGAGAGGGFGQQGLPGGGGAGGANSSTTAAQAQLVSIGDRVYFDTDRYDLRTDARGTLDKQAVWLKQVRQRIVVEGHSDERGTREYNLALSDRRARSVKDYLINQGIATDRVSTISYGKERPVAMGGGEEAWSKNRRAVTILTD